MPDHSEIQISRALDAIQIPSGDEIVLPAGTKVIITQSLGGTYTVATENGLARISSKDVDALGIDPEAEKKRAEAVSGGSSSNIPEGAGEIELQVWEALRSVFDPEIPVNIVDLGLVYDCAVEDAGEGGRKVAVKMTLTAPGCGMGPTIAADAQSKIMMVDGIADASVDLVWDPAWNQDMISEEGKMKLGLV
jgi:probable FeS assembly SUF system protein SufT